MSEAWKWLAAILGGCGVEPELQEAMSILHSLIEAYSAGEISDTELDGLGRDLCSGIVSLTARCGKEYNADTCLEDLKKVVSSSISLSALKERVKKKLKSKTSATSSSAERLI
jgi:hypothetical protein